MALFSYADIRAQLLERKQRLEKSIAFTRESAPLVSLLREVDTALNRMDDGTYGMCVVCHDPIEPDRLLVDPLIRVCLDHLSSSQQRALEEDLDLASRIQTTLLPKNAVQIHGWEIHYLYSPVGPVSGDYCDWIDTGENLFFALGDVSGKGLAASMLVSHLHAMFHSFVSFGLPLVRIAEQANKLLCESTMTTHYATIIFGKANASGAMEICNAGHLPPLFIQQEKVLGIQATGVPIGMFCEGEFTTTTLQLKKYDSLFLYTDGLSEALKEMKEYGQERIIGLARDNRSLPPRALIDLYLHDMTDYLAGNPRTDDLAIMALRRS